MGITLKNNNTITKSMTVVKDQPIWEPNADMKWAKKVCEDDVQEGFTYKVLQMLGDGQKYTQIYASTSNPVKTSDGAYYTSNAKHVWDDTNARVAECSSNTKLRWIIYYYSKKDGNSLSIGQTTMYACFDGVSFGNIFNNKTCLQYFDIINGANFASTYKGGNSEFNSDYVLQSIPNLDISNFTTMDNMFSACYSLVVISQLNTSNVTSMRYTFQHCYNLQSIPELDTSNVTSFYYTFKGCYSLQSIPKLNFKKNADVTGIFQDCKLLTDIGQLDISNIRDLVSSFSGCSSLQYIPNLDVSNCTNSRYMFYNCYALQKINLSGTSRITDMSSMFVYNRHLQSLSLDMTSVISATSAFYSCQNLEFLTLTNIKTSIDIHFSEKFSQETLEALIDNLVDLTGQTAQTLTMGTTNLSKVSQEKKDLATSKNWTLA